MPKYNYVAMDAHGKETKGTLEVASQNEAIGRVKEMGLFPTKIVEIEKDKDKGDKKAGPAAKAGAKKKGKGAQRQHQHQDPRPGRPGKVQGPHHLHPPVGDAGGCRPAPAARFARARKAGEEPDPQVDHRRAGHGDRRRQHLLRRPGPASQSLQPPLRQHGQGRRAGRRARSRAEPPLGVHGEGPEDQGQGRRRHVLPHRRADRRHRHPDHPDGLCHSQVQGCVRRHVGQRRPPGLHAPGARHQRRH